MPNPPMLSNLDFARSLGKDVERATPEIVAENLEEYNCQKGGSFNYNPAISRLRPLYEGAISPFEAIQFCKNHGNPKGRDENYFVMKAVADFVSSNRSRCYPIAFSAVESGRIDHQIVYITVKAPLARVADGLMYIVMPGFRKTFSPSESQIDVACSFALAALARGGYEGADFEYLYAGRGANPERQFRRILGSERRIYNEDDLDNFLDIYVRGIKLAMRYGVNFKRPNFRGFRVYDPNNPGFF